MTVSVLQTFSPPQSHSSNVSRCWSSEKLLSKPWWWQSRTLVLHFGPQSAVGLLRHQHVQYGTLVTQKLSVNQWFTHVHYISVTTVTTFWTQLYIDILENNGIHNNLYIIFQTAFLSVNYKHRENKFEHWPDEHIFHCREN